MQWSGIFFLNSVMLGVGLAMDAFSVSLANGLNDVSMKKSRMSEIAGTFAFFQAAMPLVGWLCVHTIVTYFTKFEILIPWIALILLGFIGTKMLIEGIRNKDSKEPSQELSFAALMLQGVATSIDALSVGFTIADYGFIMALTAALIIAVVTFIISFTGLSLGKRFGTRLSGKAQILGGVILILIGLEIFIKGISGM